MRKGKFTPAGKCCFATLAIVALLYLISHVFPSENVSESIYQFNALNIDGVPINLKNYKGRNVTRSSLICRKSCADFERCFWVRRDEYFLHRIPMYTRSYCILCIRSRLDLYNKYRDDGLEILAFPCNQFGDQEPGKSTTLSFDLIM